MRANGARTLTRIAIMVALATALHVVEAMIPIPYVVPGAKLGLANIVALYAVMTDARRGPGDKLLADAAGQLVIGNIPQCGLLFKHFRSPGVHCRDVRVQEGVRARLVGCRYKRGRCRYP